jgi:quercetin dioxygenase-like cupin family protein
MRQASSCRSGSVRGVRHPLVLCLLVLLLVLVPRVAEAQRVVMVYEEPRHRVVHVDGDVKLLDVQILPGDTTLAHTHDSAILYTFISNGSGPQNGRVSSITSYVEESYTHDVTNAGPHLFRIIAMANYGPGEREGVNTRPEGLRGEPQLENPWFRSYRIELAPGEETPVHRHRNSAAIVQVTEGRVEVSKATGFGAELTRMGDWTWRDPGSPYTIRNAGNTPVAVVVNEPRRQP